MAHLHDHKKAAAHAAKAAMHGLHGPMAGTGPHGPMMSHPMKMAAQTAAATAGGSLMSRLSRHPLLMFGLGMATGILVYKYRKTIIATAVQMGEQGKDFVLQQKETLEDIVAESQEDGESQS